MKNNKTVSVRVHINYEDIANLLYSQPYASQYWCQGCEALAYESTVQAVLRGAEVVNLIDAEAEGKEQRFYTLDLAKLKRGLTVLAKKSPRHFCDILKDDADAETADAYLQCCILGDIIYG